MKFLISSLSIMILFITSCFGASWKLQVKYPDNEVKTYQYNDSEVEINLGKFSWKCHATEAKSERVSGLKMASRQINCYNGKLFASTLVACIQSDNGVPPSSLLQIGDSKGHRNLVASCTLH